MIDVPLLLLADCSGYQVLYRLILQFVCMAVLLNARAGSCCHAQVQVLPSTQAHPLSIAPVERCSMSTGVLAQVNDVRLTCCSIGVSAGVFTNSPTAFTNLHEVLPLLRGGRHAAHTKGVRGTHRKTFEFTFQWSRHRRLAHPMGTPCSAWSNHAGRRLSCKEFLFKRTGRLNIS